MLIFICNHNSQWRGNRWELKLSVTRTPCRLSISFYREDLLSMFADVTSRICSLLTQPSAPPMTKGRTKLGYHDSHKKLALSTFPHAFPASTRQNSITRSLRRHPQAIHIHKIILIRGPGSSHCDTLNLVCTCRSRLSLGRRCYLPSRTATGLTKGKRYWCCELLTPLIARVCGA